MPGLGGRIIACLEARHATEMADLVTRHGGITYPAPCLLEVHEPDASEARLAVDLICTDTTHYVVFLTGVGVQTIAEAARRLGREEQLVQGLLAKRVAARGPKTLSAVRRIGARVDIVAPEPFTSASLLEAIQREWQLDQRTVLVQLYGAPVPAFSAALRNLGAEVVEVSPYRWERPHDEEAVVRLIEDLTAGWIDVLAVTNAAQVDHLFDIARERGHESALRRALPNIRVAAQGIVCASALEKRGIRVDLIPERASMGALVMEIAREVDPRTGDQAARPSDAHAARPSDGTVAVFAANDVDMVDVRRVIGELSADATIAVLSGKSRRGERMVEQAGIQRGLAVQRVQPVRGGGHPADDLVRRATRVLIFKGNDRATGLGKLLRLVERYAKPVQVIDNRPVHSV